MLKSSKKVDDAGVLDDEAEERLLEVEEVDELSEEDELDDDKIELELLEEDELEAPSA